MSERTPLRPPAAPRHRLLRLGVLFWCSASACSSGESRDRRGQGLELDQVFARELPSPEPLAGVAASPSGGLLAWSRGRVYVPGRGDTSKLEELKAVGRPVGAAFTAADSLVEVVDGEGGGLLRFRRGSWQGGEEPLSLPVSPQAAVRVDGRWVMAGADSAGHYRVYVLGTGGRAKLIHIVERDPARTDVPAAVQLAAAGKAVLLTELEPPFTTSVVDLGGRVRRRFAPAGPLPLPDSAQPVAHWVSLPVVSLGDGYLQTLADLGSDHRVLVLYDGAGRELRRTEVKVPMGIIGITPDHRHLVAVRHVRRPEVVLFAWRWRTHNRKGD